MLWRKLRRFRGEPIAPGTKIWQTMDGRYLVRWRSIVRGVSISPVPFYALAWTELPDGRWMWDMVSAHRTRRAAMVACERHDRERRRAEAS